MTSMTETTGTAATATTVQVYQVYIQATPEAIWEAITSSEWTARYGYHSAAEYDLRPGGAYRVLANEEMIAFGGPNVIIDGEVVESDPPRKLVQTWRPLFSPEIANEGHRRLTWEIVPGDGGVTKLTVTHDVTGAPQTAMQVAGAQEGNGGGWSFILSDLKTLLETGKPFSG